MGLIGDAIREQLDDEWLSYTIPPACGRPRAIKMARELQALREEHLQGGDGGEDPNSGEDNKDGSGAGLLGS